MPHIAPNVIMDFISHLEYVVLARLKVVFLVTRQTHALIVYNPCLLIQVVVHSVPLLVLNVKQLQVHVFLAWVVIIYPDQAA
jgi:hypothetical protein